MSQSAMKLCQQARHLWLHAESPDDLDQVESLYRQALNSKQQKQKQTAVTTKKQDNRKRKRQAVAVAALTVSQYRQAGERLSLLQCQSGRSEKAYKGLDYLGFTCRLASRVLNYPRSAKQLKKQRGKHKGQKSNSKTNETSPPCVIYDYFLSPTELSYLRKVFEPPTASYWVDHNYQVEPPSPYFSYVFPLANIKKHPSNNNSPLTTASTSTMIETLAHRIWKSPALRKKFPTLHQATMVELWAHNRPHASGHQLHFDSDDEGRHGNIRNPIVSTILYVSGGKTGGPSLITNQRLKGPNSTCLASQGWLAHPQTKRLVAFDGGVLHGVIPGKGVAPEGVKRRRVTVMMAFWKDIQVRKEPSPGSARPFPTVITEESSPEWVKQLRETPSNDDDEEEEDTVSNSMEEASPIALSHVYETLDGKPWKNKSSMPDYEQVFQGF